MGVGLPLASELEANAPPRSDITHARVAPVHSLGSGEAERLSELLKTHYTMVWRALRRLGVNANGADDAAQEVFIVLSRRLADVPAGSERTFLLGCAVRVSANFRRKGSTKHEVLVDERALSAERDPQPLPEQLVDQKRLRHDLDELLDTWPDEIRTAFVLFEIEGLSAPEIAEVTGAKLGTVASRLRRGRELFQAGAKRIRARLQGGPL